MRKTLTIDDDVAVQLQRLCEERNASLKDVINEVLRRGLKARKRFEMAVFDAGELLIKNIDCIGELLAIAEGEDYK
jgi:predicted CopG family antitoxin